MTLRKAKGIVSGSIDVNVLLAFGFGVVFIVALLFFAVFLPNPSAFSQWVFITVLALASAGAGAVIPGLIRIELPYASAGGALALFLIVFATKPAIVDAVAKFVEPSDSPLPTISAYLGKVDAGQIAEAWRLLDSEAKQGLAKDLGQIRRIYANARQPLGDVQDRIELGTNRFISPAGYPLGLYRIVNFRTRFVSGQCYLEAVSVRATDQLKWHVYDHNINPQPVVCPI